MLIFIDYSSLSISSKVGIIELKILKFKKGQRLII